MTNIRKAQLEKLHQEYFKTYMDLLHYWISPARVTCKSDRLNQTNEFIAQQAANAARIACHYSHG